MLSITNKILKVNNFNKLYLLNNSTITISTINNCFKTFDQKYFASGVKKQLDDFEEEVDKEDQRYREELNEFYSNSKYDKVEKSKRHFNQKKSKRVSPVEVFRDEIDSNRDPPKVDYVEGKLHSFPPLPGNRRTKLRSYDDEDLDYEEDDREDYRVLERNMRFSEEDDEDYIDEEAIENYGRETEEQLEELGYVPGVIATESKKSDFDMEDYERGFYSEQDKKKLKAQLEWERKKEAERDEKRKKKLLKLGFKGIDELDKRRQDLAAQIRQKGDRRLKYIKYPILSEPTIGLALLSFNLFKLTNLTNQNIIYNDDVLDIPKLSVIDVDGTKLGDMSGPEAYRLAYIKKLDIFINYTNVGIIVGRLMRMQDYIVFTEKRFLEEDKKRLDSATKSNKNILFSSTISENDRLTKVNQIKNFLLKRHTVEVTLTFKDVVDVEVADEFFKVLENDLVGVAKAQAKYTKKGGKIASNFYHPLNISERQNYIRRIEKEESASEKKLRETLEREEIDRAEENGEDPNMSAIAIKVNDLIRKKKMSEMFDEGDLNLLLEDERKQAKKEKHHILVQQKSKLAPTEGEGLSNKQIKQNINKNKNKLKKDKKRDEEEELF